MDKEKWEMLNKNQDVYAVIADGAETIQTVREKLRLEKDINGGKLQRRVDDLKDEKERVVRYPFINVQGDRVSIDEEGLRGILRDFANIIGIDLVKYEKEYREKIDKQAAEIIQLRNKLDESDLVTECQSERIRDLDGDLEKSKRENLKLQIEQKVLVAGSIKVGPTKDDMDGFFLDDPKKLLDAERLVSIYGGALDSFYEEIPTDEEVRLKEEAKQHCEEGGEEAFVPASVPGRELTLDNYRSRIMQRLGTERFFKKRLDDINTAKEFEEEHGTLFRENISLMYDPKDVATPRKRMRNKILKNRFETLNRIIASDAYTNQEKLMLFAANGNFKYTDMERLLQFASRYCINANYLIYLLQGTNPNVCDTYVQMKNFLIQFKEPSEFRMKLDLARELIEGKWYITAEYNGKKTKFQLVPIEEINELRQKAGLPVSTFGYKGDCKEKEEKPERGGAGGSADGCMAGKVDRSMTAEKYDILDDGLDVPEVSDDELPFKEG